MGSLASREERLAVSARLEQDYRDRFTGAGGGFSAFAGPTHLIVEALYGGRVGPMWSKSVRHARRKRWFGPIEPILSLDQAEREVRAEIETFLAAGAPRPRMFGKQG
jgi:hypothetical protein